MMIPLLALLALPATSARAEGLPPVPEGFNECKWNDPLHLTPKYVVGRIVASHPHTPNGLKAALPDIAAAYPGSKLSAKHKDGDSVEIPCVGVIDLVVATDAGEPDKGASWAWQVDEDWCGRCSPNRCDDVSWGHCPHEPGSSSGSSSSGGFQTIGGYTIGGLVGGGERPGSPAEENPGNCSRYQDRRDLVAEAKAELEDAGRNLDVECGDFEIVKRAAWRMRYSGAGLLSKHTGFNCEGYASDIIVFPDGRHYDVVIGGTNGPAWMDNGCADASRWRDPIEPSRW